MERINVKVKKWGNSFGIIIPKEIVNAENINENSEISIIVRSNNKTSVEDIFNLSKKLNLSKPKKSTKELLDEVDKDLWE